MTSCVPAARRGTSQKILCAVHCYSGSVDDRIKELEEQNEKLRITIRSQQNRIFEMSNRIWAYTQGKSQSEAIHGNLQAKIQRQRTALLQLQNKRGTWSPEMIIFEADVPDIVIEEDAA